MSMNHDSYDNDPRVIAAENDLWLAFKSLFDSVQEAASACHDMAVISVRAIDRLNDTTIPHSS